MDKQDQNYETVAEGFPNLRQDFLAASSEGVANPHALKVALETKNSKSYKPGDVVVFEDIDDVRESGYAGLETFEEDIEAALTAAARENRTESGYDTAPVADDELDEFERARAEAERKARQSYLRTGEDAGYEAAVDLESLAVNKDESSHSTGLSDDFSEAGFGTAAAMDGAAGLGTGVPGAGAGFGTGKPDKGGTAGSSKYFNSYEIMLIRRNPGMIASHRPALNKVEKLLDNIEKNVAKNPRHYDEGVVKIIHGITPSSTSFSEGIVRAMDMISRSSPQKYPHINAAGLRFVSGGKQADQARAALREARNRQAMIPPPSGN